MSDNEAMKKSGRPDGSTSLALARALLFAPVLLLIVGGFALALGGVASGRWGDIALGLASVAFGGLVCEAEYRSRRHARR